ncbi:hypothetical protein [Saccharothrix sp. ALI-22-I]|uniref:hypothetical protein n=1 Tax=Saccharothrix sp. ALI-22-I TaxID=1933778 RepID=UPI00117AC75E|nr:hypothetical protein [Saccharothrix sp. ALI-22-I]
MKPISFYGRARSGLLLLRLAETQGDGVVAPMVAATDGALTACSGWCACRRALRRPECSGSPWPMTSSGATRRSARPSRPGDDRMQDWGVEDLVEALPTALAPRRPAPRRGDARNADSSTRPSSTRAVSAPCPAVSGGTPHRSGLRTSTSDDRSPGTVRLHPALRIDPVAVLGLGGPRPHVRLAELRSWFYANGRTTPVEVPAAADRPAR